MKSVLTFLSSLKEFHYKYYEVSPGIYLVFSSSSKLEFKSKALDHILMIEYCIDGHMELETKDHKTISLKHGNYLIYKIKDTKYTYNNYKALHIFIDLKLLDIHLSPDLVIQLKDLLNNYHDLIYFTGNKESENLFQYFFNQPEELQMVYWKIKTIELLLNFIKSKDTPDNYKSAYRLEQIETIRAIHEDLMKHLDQRVTIETLSKKYLMNPTTLKALFKEVYGEPIASHIQNHRFELAIKLLDESKMNMAEIASSLGYDSQSKFTKAFKAHTGLTPTQYRRQKSR